VIFFRILYSTVIKKGWVRGFGGFASHCGSARPGPPHLLGGLAIRRSFFITPATLRAGPRLLGPIRLLAKYASVRGLTDSPSVLYGAHSSSHQHRSIQIPIGKHKGWVRGFGGFASHYGSARPSAQVLACSDLYAFAPFKSPLENIKGG